LTTSLCVDQSYYNNHAIAFEHPQEHNLRRLSIITSSVNQQPRRSIIFSFSRAAPKELANEI